MVEDRAQILARNLIDANAMCSKLAADIHEAVKEAQRTGDDSQIERLIDERQRVVQSVHDMTEELRCLTN